MTRSALLTALFGEEALGRIPLKLLSFGLLAGALGCAWWPHKQTSWYFWQDRVSFTPNFVSGALALAVVAPLYARQIISYPHHSLDSLVFFLLNLALTATFIEIALGQGTGLTAFPALAVIVCAITLSWFGMRSAAAFSWLGLVAFSIVSAMLSNYSWGLAGFGFVACGFCGILLQSRLNPNRLVAELISEYAPYRRSTAIPAAEVAVVKPHTDALPAPP